MRHQPDVQEITFSVIPGMEHIKLLRLTLLPRSHRSAHSDRSKRDRRARSPAGGSDRPLGVRLSRGRHRVLRDYDVTQLKVFRGRPGHSQHTAKAGIDLKRILCWNVSDFRLHIFNKRASTRAGHAAQQRRAENGPEAAEWMIEQRYLRFGPRFRFFVALQQPTVAALGAGASASAGLTAGDMIWEFNDFFSFTQRRVSPKMVADLSSPAIRAQLQAHIDSSGRVAGSRRA